MRNNQQSQKCLFFLTCLNQKLREPHDVQILSTMLLNTDSG